MAARDQDKIERGPVRLILTPTNLAGSHPTYGGTELGAFRAVEYEIVAPNFPLPYEEFGGTPGEVIEGGEWCILYGLMRQWDATALAHVFRNTTTGASSGGKVVHGTVPGTVRAGALGTARAAKILAVPENVSAHEALYLPAGFPFVVAESRVAMSVLRERVLAVAWLGLPDASGRCWVKGKIADLTL